MPRGEYKTDTPTGSHHNLGNLTHLTGGVSGTQKDSALWEQIRYGASGRVRYLDSEVDFEDTRYDPAQPR